MVTASTPTDSKMVMDVEHDAVLLVVTVVQVPVVGVFCESAKPSSRREQEHQLCVFKPR